MGTKMFPKVAFFSPHTPSLCRLRSPPWPTAKPPFKPVVSRMAATAFTSSTLHYGPSLQKGHAPTSMEPSQVLGNETLTSLNEDAFTRVFHLSALRVPADICSTIENRLRGHLLNWPRIKNIARVPGDDVDVEFRSILPNSTGEHTDPLTVFNRRVYGKAEGDGEPLNSILYRDDLAKTFNCLGYAHFRNLAKISRPKKKKNKVSSSDGEISVARGYRRNGVEIEVIEDVNEENDTVGMKRLLGEEVRSSNWRGSTRLLLLGEQYANTSIGELPEAIKLSEILTALLPNGTAIPSAFEMVGHIAHLNLRDDLLQYKSLIAKVVLDKTRPKVQTVVNKVEAIHNEYRTMELEVLAGNNSLVTTVVENGLRFNVDLKAVYWNSRLGTERQRLLSFFTRSDVVCDVFAGVGPIAISAARIVKYVYANDLNPCAVDYLARNCALNKIERKIEVFNMDGRRFIETVFGTRRSQPITQVVMNLPRDAAEFLDAFRGIFASHHFGREYTLPMIHVYGFSKAQDPEVDFLERIKMSLLEERIDPQMHRVRLVAPGKWMLCASFALPEKVAFRKQA